MMQTKDRVGLWAFAVLATTGLWAAPAVPNDSRLADAVQNQDRVLVQSLLKQHADVNGSQPDRTTALIWAASHGDLETTTLLLAAGADAKAANRYGASPLSEAASIANVSIMEKLLKAGADPNTLLQDHGTVLMAASRTGNVDAVKLLLDKGANVNAHDDAQQETALMYAANEGHLPVVRLLLSKGADVNAVAHTMEIPRRESRAFLATRATGGFTALMFAARQDNLECAKALLDAGADPRISDRDGMTPLIIAAMNGHFETAAAILEKGGDPNDGTLWEALEMRNLRQFENTGNAVIPAITGKLDGGVFVKMLLDHGADPTKPYGKMRTVRGVRGTPKAAITTTSALDRAIQGVDVEAMRLMVDHAITAGIPVDTDAVLSATVRAYPVVGPGKLIFRTVTDKDVADAVALCLDHGANINAVNLLGNSPLHLAAQLGSDSVVRLLAERGAKLDAKNKAGLTPLDMAMGKGGAVAVRGGADDDVVADAAPVHTSTAALLRQLMAGPSASNATAAKP